jgi:hypothetical protein
MLPERENVTARYLKIAIKIGLIVRAIRSEAGSLVRAAGDANQKRRKPVVRLYQERETSLDRRIAVAACADQTPWVKQCPMWPMNFRNREK